MLDIVTAPRDGTEICLYGSWRSDADTVTLIKVVAYGKPDSEIWFAPKDHGGGIWVFQRLDGWSPKTDCADIKNIPTS